MHLCTCVSEEGGDGEGAGSESPPLLSYTLRYVSLTELGTLRRVGLREPMHLCAYMDRGEDADSEAPSLLSYTLRYVSKFDEKNFSPFFSQLNLAKPRSEIATKDQVVSEV